MNQNEGTAKEDRAEVVNDGLHEEHGPAATTGGEPTGLTTGSSDMDVCPDCGHVRGENKGLEQFLSRLGITDDMLSNLKAQFQNVDIDEYLNTAREHLKGSSSKVTAYTKENPAKVAAGVAALTLGAGLIYAAVNRGGTRELEDGLRQLELKRALDGPMYRLDEVLRELDVTV
jgi:hypothetical protein